MTVRDKLTHDERLRLEALAQAIAYHASVRGLDRPSPSPSKVTETAATFAIYVAGK